MYYNVYNYYLFPRSWQSILQLANDPLQRQSQLPQLTHTGTNPLQERNRDTGQIQLRQLEWNRNPRREPLGSSVGCRLHVGGEEGGREGAKEGGMVNPAHWRGVEVQEGEERGEGGKEEVRLADIDLERERERERE